MVAPGASVGRLHISAGRRGSVTFSVDNATEPVLVKLKAYVMTSPTSPIAPLPLVSATVAVFDRVIEATPPTGVPTLLVQRASVGHVASPPPESVAVFVKVKPPAVAFGVTGMMKLVLAAWARPAGMVPVSYTHLTLPTN